MAKDPKDGIARLKATERNVQQAPVFRICGITTEPMTVRHVINQISLGPPMPYFAGLIFAGVKTNGLRISPGGAQGQFGDGAYAWPADKDVGQKQYIDVRIPAGTAVEYITQSGEEGGRTEFFRVMPHPQDGLHVAGSEIIGTNIDPRAIEMYEALSKGDIQRAEMLSDLLSCPGAGNEPDTEKTEG